MTAPGAQNGDHKGAIYIFDRTEGAWERRSKIYPEEISDTERPRFGGFVSYSGSKPNPVALTEDTLAVGAAGVDVNNQTNAGTVVLFDRLNSDNQQAMEYQTQSGEQNDTSNRNSSFGIFEWFDKNRTLPFALIGGGTVGGIGLGAYRHYKKESKEK